MSVTKAALDNALAAIFVPPLTLGLRSGLSEVRDGGYKQQAISLTSPKSVDGVREMANNAKIRFGPFLTDFEEDIDGWVMLSKGMVVAEGPLSRPRRPQAGEETIFRPGELSVGIKEKE